MGAYTLFQLFYVVTENQYFMNLLLKMICMLCLIGSVNVIAQEDRGTSQEGLVKTTSIDKESLFNYTFENNGISNEVVSFKLRINTRPTILIKGDQLDDRAKSAIARAPKNSKIILFDIRREQQRELDVAAIQFILE